MDTIKRPVLVVDEDRCRANIRSMLVKSRANGAFFRPHFKTHQSVQVGRWFREEGVDGIAVSSVSMARMFADDGWKDIMIAFPVNFREMGEINELAGELDLGLLISCPEAMKSLLGKMRHPAGLYLKVDVGTQRTGFDPGNTGEIGDSLALAASDPNLRPRGFVAHAGHTYQAESAGEILRIFSASMEGLLRLKERFIPKHPGLSVSWGDTPSCTLSDHFFGADEIRPGNFVFYDGMQLELGVCSKNQIAMTVAAPVVAVHPARSEAVVYAGAVHLSKEQGKCAGGRIHYGRLVFYTPSGKARWPEKDIFVRRISQEHGIIEMPDEMLNKIRCGDLLGIVPVHACLAADLVRTIHVV